MTAIPDFDPARDGIYERKMIEKMRDDLRNALLKLELRQEDVARLKQRNAYLEGELKLQEQYLTNALKDNIVLKKQLAEMPAKLRPAPPADLTELRVMRSAAGLTTP